MPLKFLYQDGQYTRVVSLFPFQREPSAMIYPKPLKPHTIDRPATRPDLPLNGVRRDLQVRLQPAMSRGQ